MPTGEPSPHARYLFGDTDLAAERLHLLARVFEPSTRELLSQLASRAPRTIADLGCGPGCTTRLLAEVFPGAHVLGLDSSEHFIELARREIEATDALAARVEFTVVDVAASLPGGPFDLVYARYLLTHLPQPVDAIASWGRQLCPGGLIVVEENEWIDTAEPVFARYLAIAAAMLAAGNQRLYVGADLAQVASWPGLKIARSEVVPIAATNRDTAGMFLRNLASWREQSYIQEHVGDQQIDALHSDLERLTLADAHTSSIVFGRRRLVLEKSVH